MKRQFHRAIAVAGVALGPFLFSGCETTTMSEVAGVVGSVLPSITGQSMSELTTAEIVTGLKEALKVGTTNASRTASRPNGFYGNSALRIPFPQDAIEVKNFATNLGLGNKVELFEQKMNGAAEQASGKAADVFIDAIMRMSFSDAKGILRGGDTAATDYFRRKTTGRLRTEFAPIVNQALTNMRVAKSWDPLATAYNASPFAKRQVDPDLQTYVTERAIDGLFLLIASEEKKIRENPAARVSEILRKVFGSRLAQGS